MSNLKTEQPVARGGDLGGLSSVTVLAFALVLCLEWCLLMNWGA